MVSIFWLPVLRQRKHLWQLPSKSGLHSDLPLLPVAFSHFINCPFPSHHRGMLKAGPQAQALQSPPGRVQLHFTGRAPMGILLNVTVNCTASALCYAQDNLLDRAFPWGVAHQVLFLKNLGQVIPAVALMTSMSYSRGEIGPLFFMSICHVPIKGKKCKRRSRKKRKVIEPEDYPGQRLTSRCGMLLSCSCCTLINITVYGKRNTSAVSRYNESSAVTNYIHFLYPVLIKNNQEIFTRKRPLQHSELSDTVASNC